MNTPECWRIENDLVEVGVLEVGGQLGPVRFRHRGGMIEPMHVAPWSGEPGASPMPMLRFLRGDFFCAPFGANDVSARESRDHGKTANGRWRLLERDGQSLELELEGRVSGALVRKEVRLRPGHPVVYQRHTFEGGSGSLPLGHHAMLRAPEGDRLRLSFAPFVWAGTPPEPVEGDPARGLSLLRYPQRFRSLDTVATAAGKSVDLSRYPVLEDSEEIVMLVTDPAEEFGWSAAVAPRSGWLWFSVRPNRVLRNTMLWLSNGGRRYAPFLGRHRRVIGIEEVTSYFHLGHRAGTLPNELTRQGFPTAVELSATEPLVVSYAFGAVPTPPGFDRVATLEVGADSLQVADDEGGQLSIPFDASYFAGNP